MKKIFILSFALLSGMTNATNSNSHTCYFRACGVTYHYSYKCACNHAENDSKLYLGLESQVEGNLFACPYCVK